MIQFVAKHYTGFHGRIYAFFLRIAIAFRAFFAFSALSLKKKSAPTRSVNTFLRGDVETLKNAKKSLTGALVTNVNEADEVVLCEGNNFSFIDIIEFMKRSPGRSYRVVTRSRVEHGDNRVSV